MSKINSLLIPNVNKTSKDSSRPEKSNRLTKGESSDFKGLLKQQLLRPQSTNSETANDVKISGHASKRLEERNIKLDTKEYIKLKEAMSKLRSKGGHDSLVITQKAAYVVDVDKNTVVTAVDKNKMNENVFTKIDSTIFMM